MVRQIVHPGVVSPPISPSGRGGVATEPEPEPEPELAAAGGLQQAGGEPARTPDQVSTSTMSARDLVKWAEQLSSRSPTGRLANALKEAAVSPPKDYTISEERLEALALKTVAAVSQGAGALHRQLEQSAEQKPTAKLTLKSAKVAVDLATAVDLDTCHQLDVSAQQSDSPGETLSAKSDSSATLLGAVADPSVSGEDSYNGTACPAGRGDGQRNFAEQPSERGPAGASSRCDSNSKNGPRAKSSANPKPARQRANNADLAEGHAVAASDACRPVSRKLTRPDPSVRLSNLKKDGTVKPCRFGLECTREGCWFAHPEGYTPPPPGSDDIRGAQRRAELLRRQQQEQQQRDEPGQELKDSTLQGKGAGQMENKTRKQNTKLQRKGTDKKDSSEDFVVTLRSDASVPDCSTPVRGRGKGSKNKRQAGVAPATRDALERLIRDWVNSRGGEAELDELVANLGNMKVDGGPTYGVAAKQLTKQPTVAKAVLAIVESSSQFETRGDGHSRRNAQHTSNARKHQRRNQHQKHNQNEKEGKKRGYR